MIRPPTCVSLTDPRFRYTTRCRSKVGGRIACRVRRGAETGVELHVWTNPECVAQGISPISHGATVHTDVMKTQALKQALDRWGFDAAIGGARRDEEKSRAKEDRKSTRLNSSH